MQSIHSRWRKPKPRTSVAKKRRAQLSSAASVRKRFGDIAQTSTETPAKKVRMREEQILIEEEEEREYSQSSTNLSASTSSTQPSASARKIRMFEELLPLSDLEPQSKSSTGEYILVSVSMLKELVQSLLCKECKVNTVHLEVSESKGFASKLKVKCSKCDSIACETMTSDRVKDKSSTRPPYAVNRKMTEAFLSIGLGHGGMTTFSTAMGMNMLSKTAFDKHVAVLSQNIQKFKDAVLEESRRMTRRLYELENIGLKSEKVLDTVVSYDGTWQRRGFSSLYGLGFVIDIKSGLVVDFEIISKYCYCCMIAEKSMDIHSEEFKSWYAEHTRSGYCNKNFSGSSQLMETEAASRIWKRSEQYGLRFTSIVSDGDAKTFLHLQKVQPYGPDVAINKEECINHVSKRLYTAMKELVKTCRAQKITLGGAGEGQLTESVMSKLASYYRLAIERNLDSVPDMQNSILATLDHCSSTDAHPNHKRCATGKESWCFYNKAKAKGQKPMPHKNMQVRLNKKVVEHLHPLYARLTDAELLER